MKDLSLISLLFLFVLGNTNIEPLSWNTRLKIATDAARGLAFLHSSDKQVIYRDFKASNVLLDGVSYFFCWSYYLILSISISTYKTL